MEPAMEAVTLNPIGIIRSPFGEPRGTPIQAAALQRASGSGSRDAAALSRAVDAAGSSRPAAAAVSDRDAGRGRVEILPEYREGLEGLEGFSHVILIYYCHRTHGWTPRVKPFLDQHSHGVFATRAPARPNPLGLSVVRLLGTAEGVLEVEGLDVVDGTPLLDLKPYVPQFDSLLAERIGWLEGRVEGMGQARDDGRFVGGDRGKG